MAKPCAALILAMAVMAACHSNPAPIASPAADPSNTAEYEQAVGQLIQWNRDAGALLVAGKLDDVAAIVTKAQPLITRVLSVPRPTLAAMEAASDLDDLYGRMLLANRHYGWARLLFQKNRARWKNWRPQTADTQRRTKLAESQIADCDRRLAQ